MLSRARSARVEARTDRPRIGRLAPDRSIDPTVDQSLPDQPTQGSPPATGEAGHGLELADPAGSQPWDEWRGVARKAQTDLDEHRGGPFSVTEGGWLSTIRAKRRAQTIRALVFIVGAMAVWLSLSELGVWVWVSLFHRLPPSFLFLKWYVGLGSLIVMPLGALAPLAPMKGKDPEVIAAD